MNLTVKKNKVKKLIFILSSFLAILIFSNDYILADDIDVTVSIGNSAPAFTIDVREQIASDGLNPTDAGDTVTFIATAGDPNLEDYYLAICQTDAITPVNGGAPTCPGGEWAISGATGTGLEASTDYITLPADSESNDWYGFVCDGNTGAAACSLSSQGPEPELAGSIDTDFDTINNNFTFEVRVIEPSSSGSVFVGGTFDTFDGQSVPSLIKLDGNGNKDNSFSTQLQTSNTVTRIEELSDGKLLVLGNWNDYGGTDLDNIVKLNSDGSIDSTFDSTLGANSSIEDLAFQDANNFIAVGNFTQFRHTDWDSFGDAFNVNRVIRLDINGDYDQIFDNNTGTGANGIIYSVAIQPDGKIIAGNFTSFDGNSVNRLARLNSDGTFDNTFNIGTGFSNAVRDIHLQPDGKIIAVGNFTSFNSNTANRIVRLNTDGSIDNTFNSGTGATGNILDIDPLPAGGYLIGGDFFGYNGSSSGEALRLARINDDGSRDTSFTTNGGANGTVFSVSADLINSDKGYIGGRFGSYFGQSVPHAARVNLVEGGGEGAPFKVNHRPSFTLLGNDGPINPGGTVTYTATATDSDIDTSADTVRLLVCKTPGISGTDCDGGSSDTWCASATSTSNPSCDFTVDNPLPDGNYDGYGYVFDNHDFASDGVAQGSNNQHVVNNIAPIVTGVTIENTIDAIPGSDIFLTENTTTNYTIRATITDDNSCVDLNTVEASLYRSGIGYSGCDTNGESNNNNCYAQISCSVVGSGNTCGGNSDASADYECLVAVQYHADPTDTNTVFEAENWLTTVNGIDDDTASGNTELTSGVELLSLVAYDVTSSIDYGTLSAGEDSGTLSSALTTQATGNVGLDQELSGLDLTSGLNTIVVTSQRYSLAAATTFVSGIQLTNTAAETELNVQKTTLTATPEEGETYFGIEIPLSTVAGTYTGTNTVVAVKSEIIEW